VCVIFYINQSFLFIAKLTDQPCKVKLFDHIQTFSTTIIINKRGGYTSTHRKKIAVSAYFERKTLTHGILWN
jgi:hypothetical protein